MFILCSFSSVRLLFPLFHPLPYIYYSATIINVVPSMGQQHYSTLKLLLLKSLHILCTSFSHFSFSCHSAITCIIILHYNQYSSSYSI
ncbi:hypothetical protein GGU11DRAFT_285236 [Lentinula aff. detonsa]|nr:hypothetical protein GGU11DRAFT_285236 [Lentinula aff. detonsa]